MPPFARRPTVGLPDHLLCTADGVLISARHEPLASPPIGAGPARSPAAGDGPAAGNDPGADDGVAGRLGFVVAHGFTGSWRRPDVQGVIRRLRAFGGVIGFDFRGHGSSGGVSTVGDREIWDLRAAVEWARELGYRRVVTVGWSMGAAVAIRHAALIGGVDAVVAVSGPARWHYRGTPSMRVVHRAIETAGGRWVAARAFGTRIATDGWAPPPEPPDAVVGRISPTPLLLVHGDADTFFPVEHARWLAAAARDPFELWLEPGFGHAEAAASAQLLARIARWARGAAAAPADPVPDSTAVPVPDSTAVPVPGGTAAGAIPGRPGSSARMRG